MSVNHERMLVARLGEEFLAFPLESVRELLDAPQVQALPLAPPALRGHLTLRGQHLSVLDAGVLLGVRAAASASGVALVFHDGFALLFDDADDVWDPDDVATLSVPGGSDRLGLLRALLRRGDVVASLVDAAALSTRALATLREHASV